MESTPERSPKPTLRERFNVLLSEWGPLLIVVYLGIFFLVWAGFVLAIKFGFQVESTAGTWGTLGAAYVATQLTKPLRIVATLVITPALGTLLKRFRRTPPPSGGASATHTEEGAERVPPARVPLDETPSGQG